LACHAFVERYGSLSKIRSWLRWPVAQGQRLVGKDVGRRRMLALRFRRRCSGPSGSGAEQRYGKDGPIPHSFPLSKKVSRCASSLHGHFKAEAVNLA
jgi:hypothetical protein